MRFFRQGYWSGLPCPPPGDFPNPGIEPMSSATPVLKVDFHQWATREAQWWYRTIWWYGDSQWCYLTIASSVASFSLCPQSFPVSRSFPISQLFTSGGQSIGASASTLVLPMNIQGWFPLGLTGLISLMFKGLSRVFSSTTCQKHQFFSEF